MIMLLFFFKKNHLGRDCRTYRDAKVEWTETSDIETIFERTMLIGKKKKKKRKK